MIFASSVIVIRTITVKLFMKDERRISKNSSHAFTTDILYVQILWIIIEAYSEPCQTSKMEHLAEISSELKFIGKGGEIKGKEK